MKIRCKWAGLDPVYIDYHDNEWGVEVHDDRLLFEFLVLEGAQAGLNWITILKKRNNYKAAFDGFDPEKISRYDSDKIRALLENKGIIRNRLKIESAVNNARAFLAVKKEFNSFDAYIWSFVGGKQKTNAWETYSRIPGYSKESTAMSRDLKKRGFGFAGPTICYAFMQATGMVNDHTTDCFRYKEIKTAS
ncbi:MAG: DNA-3-methyladenine glycosylase I [Desulfobacterales bacterium]